MIFCDICKRSFPRKYNYDRHLSRLDHINFKNPVSRVINMGDNVNLIKTEMMSKEMKMDKLMNDNWKIMKEEKREISKEVGVEEIVEDKFECKKCGNSYSTRSNLNRHLRKCIPPMSSDVKNEEFYQVQILQMQNQINTLINKMGSGPTFVQNINQKIENTVNQANFQQININAYGKENMDYITINDMRQLIQQPKACLPKFIELLHYDENHPENHNVVLESIKNNMIKILQDNNRWAYQIFEKFVEQFTLEKYDQLYDLLLDYDTKADIDEILKDKFEKWADRFDNEDSNTRKKAEEDVKLALISGSTWLRTKGKKRPTKRAIMKMLEKENISNSLNSNKIKGSIELPDDKSEDNSDDGEIIL